MPGGAETECLPANAVEFGHGDRMLLPRRANHGLLVAPAVKSADSSEEPMRVAKESPGQALASS